MKTGIELWEPAEADYPPGLSVGSGHSLSMPDVPDVRYPIGFLGRNQKPRVRVKAVMQPIPKVSE
jgi:hypothetical protein